ncbi:hypothetical protein BS329_29795 [Amycolatopsis coloradensis]|uniref:Uncharacterized protein n=1 Tax=Amycolatopsis coloradensis TaxID=76021 RepID=A0A1R0KJX8_9PSEU|nr:hypothetical protein [Amycolatopsis coloradensis]OLZ46434.1 hypothetical protein BS329_29795 [Amycolatopsis coloradensis]
MKLSEALWLSVRAGAERAGMLLAYTAFIGLIQELRASGGTLLSPAGRPGYLEFMRGIITR